MNYKKFKIAIIGIGYVGLPLAIEFSKKRKVVAFDYNHKRIQDLIKGYDSTFEISTSKLKKTNSTFGRYHWFFYFFIKPTTYAVPF